MPVNIKNDQTEVLARKLAELTKETPADELNEIAMRCAKLAEISPLRDDEILGYDEYGAPSR